LAIIHGRDLLIITVASGKGGTGKTTVAVNLALSLGNVNVLDCDVEEPNAHTLLHPENVTTEDVTVPTPIVNQDSCTLCGKCGEFCQFNAIFVGKTKVLIYDEICHSCGGCALVCPEKAIEEQKRTVGKIKSAEVRSVHLTFGELNIGEPMAVPVIKAVKERIVEGETNILDAPPGTSCTVIETVQESDYVILVTEPTPFGLHDLMMTVDVVDRLDVPYGVIINRSTIGDSETSKFLREKRIPIIMEIPFDRKIAELYSEGVPFVRELPEYRSKFQEVVKHIEEVVTNGA
jgi:MinD superfamily P-loop ATPase